MGSKTPVSILQEMMTRMGTTPKYDLIYDGSGTHTAVFKFRVFANDVSAIGTGRSKKEAKHEAARIALERLSLSQIEDSQTRHEPVEIMTPYKDKLQENAIGELNDMCATNDIPMPEYQLVEEKGAPHEKIFTFMCNVSKQTEIGIGRTKKQAKQLAAYNMMNRLKESLADVLAEKSEEPRVGPLNESFEEATAKYKTSVRTPRRKVRLNKSPCKFENYLSELPEEDLIAAMTIVNTIGVPENPNDKQKMEVDWMLLLNSVTECLHVEKMVMPGRLMKNGDKCLFLQLNLCTEAVFYGTGKSDEEALQDAAFNSLMFMKVQMRSKHSAK